MKSLLFTLSLSLFTFAFAQEAELPKEKGGPRHFEFEVPATYLKKGENVLELRNTSRRWMEVVYVVVQTGE